jgi:hypothetical protein
MTILCGERDTTWWEQRVQIGLHVKTLAAHASWDNPFNPQILLQLREKPNPTPVRVCVYHDKYVVVDGRHRIIHALTTGNEWIQGYAHRHEGES